MYSVVFFQPKKKNVRLSWLKFGKICWLHFIDSVNVFCLWTDGWIIKNKNNHGKLSHLAWRGPRHNKRKCKTFSAVFFYFCVFPRVHRCRKITFGCFCVRASSVIVITVFLFFPLPKTARTHQHIHLCITWIHHPSSCWPGNAWLVQ